MVVVGAAESPYRRHPPDDADTTSLLVDAARRAMAAAGVGRDEIDGLAVSSFTLGPDHAIDLAWRMGMSLDWIMEDAGGGASGLAMLLAAKRAIEAGDASTVLLLAGDRYTREDFARIVDGYNAATRDWLAPLPFDGPNTLFAFVTQRHMREHGLEPRHYGELVLGQRRWAARNPGAVYRAPLTMEDYLAAPPVAPPLGRYDCVPIVSGADAVIVSAGDGRRRGPSVRVGPVRARYNDDKQEGDGWITGLAHLRQRFWEEAGLGPGEVGHLALYDDYPVIVLAQLADLGFVADGDVERFIATKLAGTDWPLNTSGGQLSAGQAGAGAGLHGLVEAVLQLRGEAGERQVSARTSLVTGYGMVVLRHGACANAALLERTG